MRTMSPHDSPADEKALEAPRLPGLRTWNQAYVRVVWVFILWVVGLTLLPYLFA